MLYLDGTVHSKLDWNSQLQKAEGKNKVVWELDLGLFSRLPYPLEDETQFQTLKLSIDHFNQVVWEKFGKNTSAICLYKGPLNFGICEDPYRSRDAGAELLEMLAAYFPEEAEVWIHCESGLVKDPLERALLSTKEKFQDIRVIVDQKMEEECPFGICLPSVDRDEPGLFEELAPVFRTLEEQKKPYRVIPEPMIMTEWHGLDTLLVSPRTLTPKGERQLQGFQAAGGKVVWLE